LINNPGNNDSPLQLPSVHHNPSCGGCARDAEEMKDHVKKGFSQRDVAKKRLGVM